MFIVHGQESEFFVFISSIVPLSGLFIAVNIVSVKGDKLNTLLRMGLVSVPSCRLLRKIIWTVIYFLVYVTKQDKTLGLTEMTRIVRMKRFCSVFLFALVTCVTCIM